METWRPVVSFEGIYEVSDMGNIRSIDRISISQTRGLQRIKGKPLRPGRASTGYPTVALCVDGRPKTHCVHVLVAEAFIGPRPEGHVVDHIDQTRDNNKVGNLRYVTQTTNMQNVSKFRNKTGAKGVTPNGSGFMALIGRENKTVYLGTYRTVAEAARARKEYEIKIGWAC